MAPLDAPQLPCTVAPAGVRQGAPTQKNAQSNDWAFCCNSLTMSYFHTGIRTIMALKRFTVLLGRGRSGTNSAMVVRHNFLPP